jgi:hypothetical protein
LIGIRFDHDKSGGPVDRGILVTAIPFIVRWGASWLAWAAARRWNEKRTRRRWAFARLLAGASYAGHSCDSSSACSSTVWVAFSCLSGG